MIDCIIIDDEEHAIELLTRYIEKTPFLNLVFSGTNPVEALKLLNQQKIDLIFLDVQMPEMSGIDLIKAIGSKSKVILTTAYSEYALEGFENEVIDYLLKPIPFARFIRAAQRALSRISPRDTPPAAADNDYIFLKTEQKGKLVKINIADIVYVEGLKNYVSIVTRDGKKVIALLNIKDLEERLPAADFCRTHKSFILSVACIRMIEGNRVHLEHTGNTVPVGERFREAFMQRMKKKLMSK